MTSTADLALYRRITLRVVPPLIALYFVAFLDRVNISFAALTMNRDLGIPDDLYGLAAGVFFAGYLLFAVPSNMALERFGARRWIALLMVTWGVLSASMALVHHAPSYIALRFLIGAAEAGFFPGIIFYLTQWLPGSARAGIMAMFTLAIPLSSVVGSPISAAILRMNGAHGLAGWQWLFLLEATPAVLLGLAVPWMLTPGPASAGWLSPAEKRALAFVMASESTDTALPLERTSWSFLLQAAAIYFMLTVGLYGLGFWTPKLLASRGITLVWLGWATAVPFAFGAVGMMLLSRWSDRTGERRVFLAALYLLAALGFAGAALFGSAAGAIAGLACAAVGTFAGMAVFWAAVTQRISPGQSAFTIAAVNSVGNVGGFLGPYATGYLLQRTHGYTAGLEATAACLVLGAGMAVWAIRTAQPVRREQAA